MTLRDNGRLRHVAACNFDRPHLEAMVDEGVPIVSNQVQYSLLDRRPENGMLAYAKAKGIRLATFGTVAGGLLSDRWLGAPPPTREQLATVSLRMYFTPLNRWTGGNWDLFQKLLSTLRAIADKHGTTIANVASAWVLRQLGPDGGWVILGNISQKREMGREGGSVAGRQAGRQAGRDGRRKVEGVVERAGG